MSEIAELFCVSNEVLLKHERVLIKQMIHIFYENELMQGPMNEFPKKNVAVPAYAGPDKIKDDTIMAYAMIEKDPLGERKVSINGELRGGRTYLCNTFKLASSPHMFVLSSHLLETLQYEGSEESFFEKYNQLMPLVASSEEEEFFVEKGFVSSRGGPIKYVTARSAFVQFGAALIASGLRVFDDYWETIANRQNLTPHHRVFRLSQKLIHKLADLKPSMFSSQPEEPQVNFADVGQFFESPYANVTEQVSPEIRQQYGREFCYGQHISVVVPGQSIGGSLELSAQCKIPKYHSKNSFQQATQMKALDIPIGSSMPTREVSTTALKTQDTSSTSSNKLGKRMLNSILDVGTSAKTRKVDDQDVAVGLLGSSSSDESLNIDGWKFESLPLKTAETNGTQRSLKGLPLYEKGKLITRLKSLTPNQVKELEHLHDAVFLNVGLQNVRKLRSRKWAKYWQYKSGVPVGLQQNEIGYFKDHYLKEVLEQTSSVTNFNPETNTDEIYTTTRQANANYLGNSNIHGFKPPYVPGPGDAKH